MARAALLVSAPREVNLGHETKDIVQNIREAASVGVDCTLR
jgi:hypothetical protein